MLEVIVNIVPYGDESKRKQIGKMYLINTGDHPKRPEYGRYTVHHDGGSFLIQSWRRDAGFWGLIRKALNRYLNP